MTAAQYKLIVVLFVCLLLFASFPNETYAVVSSCTASVDTSSVNTNTNANFGFTINNTSSQTIAWIKISRPSSNFTLGGYAVGGWSISMSESDATLTGGSLAASANQAVSIGATSGSTEASSANWTVQVSDDSGGASPTSCTGTLGTAISGAGADTTLPTISNIVLSDLSDTSLKISWTTDENATTVVDYGTTDAYGSTATGDSSVTSHSVTISSLSANTTYHYRLKSSDSAGNETIAGDYTFATAKVGTTTTTSTTVTVTNTKTVTVTKTIKDDTPPNVFLDTDFDKPYTEPPKITGLAKDSGDVNPGIGRVEYSFDDGKTWLEVDSIKSPNARSTAFSFVPAIFEDGNFKLKVRAYDNSGNVTASSARTLIIDRLPPQIGGILFSIGPQIIQPGKDGMLYISQGLDTKITLSSVGGALVVDLFADSKSYSLIKNPDSGLWSATLNFADAGEFILKSKSVDGADNTTEKDLIKVNVLESGKVSGQPGKALEGVGVSVYYFEGGLAKFVLWDGKPFGQENPQKTSSDGGYKLLLPAGKYYIQLNKFGYKTAKTNIFTLGDSRAIDMDFTLKRNKGIQLGSFFIPFFDFSFEEQSLKLDGRQEVLQSGGLVGTELPYFVFKREEKDMDINSFKGKPTVLTFSAIWSPENAQQISILQNLTKNQKNINAVPVMVQEKVSKTGIFEKVGSYNIKIFSDPDGELSAKLNIFNMPTHVFLDRKGIVKKIVPGVLTEDELLENLVN